jgi:enamine deaminase RidA (YjgF/YER057c/UK114 family)
MTLTHPESRLSLAGLTLPVPMPPTANYVPFRRTGNLLYLSGHGPKLPDGSYMRGRLETAEDISRGYEAARQTALNMLATIKMAIGDLSRVESIVKLLGMVHATSDFAFHPKVIDGCSDLLVAVFDDAGTHARSAVGMGSLPHGMIVEIEAILVVRD